MLGICERRNNSLIVQYKGVAGYKQQLRQRAKRSTLAECMGVADLNFRIDSRNGPQGRSRRAFSAFIRYG